MARKPPKVTAPVGSPERTKQLIASAKFFRGGGQVAPSEDVTTQPATEAPLPEVVGAEPIEEGVDVTQPSPEGVQIQPAGQVLTDPLTGRQFQRDEQGILSARGEVFQQGFQRARDEGIQAPVTGGAGRALVAGAVGPAPQEETLVPPSPIAQLFQTDPFIASLIQSWQEHQDVVNQRASMVELFESRYGEVESIDMELVDMKAIIEGSEDDIRNEITKAGGFATESQVLALTNSRNKQLIKNYNKLLDTRNAKEKYISTLVGLEAQDRASADRQFDSMMNFGIQVAQFQQQAIQNSRNTLQKVADSFGWSNVMTILGNDKQAIDLASRAMGFDIRAAAGLPDYNLLERELGIKLDQAQLAKTYAEIARLQEGTVKPASQAQFTVAGFAARIEQSEGTLATQEANIAGMSLTSFWLQSRAPATFQSPDFQLYDQAARNFINATLRRESGAAIAESEFVNARAQYLPLPGNTPQVLREKEINRRIVFENFKSSAGTAYSSVEDLLGGRAPEATGGGVYTLDGVDYVEAEDGLFYPVQ